MNILLHICCANCALYPVKIIRGGGHKLAGFWFNPNIQPYQEYELRLNSLKDLSGRWQIDMIYRDEGVPTLRADKHVVARDRFTRLPYWSNEIPKKERDSFSLQHDKNVIFSKQSRQGFCIESQRPERCTTCYRRRLGKTAEEAQRQGFDAFSTTLLISPYQDFEQIVKIGSELAEQYNVLFYIRDFRQYFRDTMTYARELSLYRQKYCGCMDSREERFGKKGITSGSENLNQKFK